MHCDLRDLISHNHWVEANQTLGLVFQTFARHSYDFMAVLQDKAVAGICSRRDIGMLLGSKYGFSLFAAKPVKEHLLPAPIGVKLGTSIQEVFAVVFAREQEAFYDDILLVDQDGGFLGLISTQTLIKLQNRCHLESIQLLEQQRKEISLKNEQIEADLRLSRELQQALLPIDYPSFPPHARSDMDMLRFHHYYRPFGIVGGDFFHIKKVGDLAASVFIADVMGHGVRSAVITAMLRAMLEGLDNEVFKQPTQVLAHVNRELTRILQQSVGEVIFASALHLLVDAETRTLHYASAGHPLPVHLQTGHGKAEILDHSNPGTLLGVFEEAEFSASQQTYAPGDAIMMFTDGITEVEDSVGQEFGSARLCEAISGLIGHPSQQLFDGLIHQAEAFSADGFADDICLVLVELA